MRERFGERVENSLIEVGILARDIDSNVLAAMLGDVPHDARNAAKELLDGNHTNFQNALVKLVEHAGLKSKRIREFQADGIARMALVKVGKSAMQHGFSDD